MKNLYDFDKTIYKKDSSFKFYFYCMKYKPVMFFNLFYLGILYIACALKMITVTKFKQKFFSFLKKFDNIDEVVSSFWKKEIKNISPWYLKQKQDGDVICSASPEFLIRPVINLINPQAELVATNMNKHTGEIVGLNCKGEEKVARLKSLYAQPLFNNAYSDSVSDLPMMDLAVNKFIVCGKKVYPFGKQKPTFFKKIKYLIKQMRPTHYIKNVLIFFPLFFSKNLFNLNNFCLVLVETIAFCLATSFVYIVNDLKDAKNDRQHSKKRLRPIASYMVKPWEAITLAIALLAGSVCISIFALDFNIYALCAILGYVVLNLLYSFWLKNLPIVDVFALSACYLIRLYFGGLIINVAISNWLFLTVLTASLFMGLTKRRNEFNKEKNDTRAVKKHYTANFLDKNAYLCLTLTMAFYSLWAIELTPVANKINNILILISIPVVYFILMRYSLDIEKTESSGNPMDVLLKDIWLIAFVIVYIAVLFVALYLPITVI